MLRDYYYLNVLGDIDDPCFQKILDIIDPIGTLCESCDPLLSSHDLVYTDRLTIPKYIISALGDEFFLPDDYIFFLNDLQGVTYIRSALAIGGGSRGTRGAMAPLKLQGPP